MRYYYLIGYDMPFAVCFNTKKDMIHYAIDNSIYRWYYVNNKKDIPKNISAIIGNDICKDYKAKNNQFIMKDSLKDKKKED